MTDELVEYVEANYFGSYRALTSAIDAGEVHEWDGMLITATGVPTADFNVAFVTRPLQDPNMLIQKAIRYFDDRGLPFVLRIREGVDQRSERAAEALGLPYSDTVPGMVLSPLTVIEDNGSGLEIRTADNATGLRQHHEVVAAGSGMPLAYIERLMCDKLLALPDVRIYVGYAAGSPVTTSALIMTNGIAGVYNVTTLENFRRRGFGETMTAHAIREGAAAGCKVAALQSSNMGRRIYERMGFRTVAPYRTFTRPATADGQEA